VGLKTLKGVTTFATGAQTEALEMLAGKWPESEFPQKVLSPH
jgi:hypothetical protein